MTAGSTKDRVVITGVGTVSPIGIGNEAFWQNLSGGHSGIGLLRSFPSEGLPSKLAAEIHDFNPLDFLSCGKFLKVMSRDIQLGVAAAVIAMKDAGLRRHSIDPERLGVEFGAGRMSTTPEDLADAVSSSSGDRNSFEATRWGEDSIGRIAPLWLLKSLPNMPACHVAIEFDARGPNNTITSRDSSALLALSEAVRVIERDAADCMVVGACGSNIQPVDIAKFNLFESLTHRDDPHRACLPFDKRRDGTVVGEGAGAFIVERYEHAVKRGATIYAEVLGVGEGCDGTHYSNGGGGLGLVRSIGAALRRAEIDPREIGHINANGKSSQRDDVVESRAFHQSLGRAAESIPVVGLKSYFGHSDAGSGAVELAGSLLAMRYGTLPRTLNYELPDPRCRLNVVRDEPKRLKNFTALSVNRTAMGQSAAAIIRSF